MKTYKEFCFGEEYLDEGKAKAAKELLKRGGKHGKKLLDKVKGVGSKVKDGAKKVGGKGKLGAAAVGGGAAAGVGLLGKGAYDLLKGTASEVAKRAGKIWAGGTNDVDSDGAPSDHSGLPKSN